MPKPVEGLLRWVVALALPAFLVLTVPRLLIADWFPRYEYSKAGFPRDRYGWTQQERLDLALPSIHFLNSPLPPEQAIKILQAQRYPDSNLSLFTPNELGHMIDVKRVMDGLWRVEYGAGAALFAGLALLLIRRETRPSAWLGLFFGGILTTALLAALAFFVVTGFDTFFVLFHEIFFPQGNWTFDYTDSLIRLFPEQFWFDAGLLIALGTLAAGVIAGVAGRLLWRRSLAPARASAGEARPPELAQR